MSDSGGDATHAAIALIAAGGSGQRLGANRPKALVPCGGRAMLAWCLDALAASVSVTRVAIAVVDDERAQFEELAVQTRSGKLEVLVCAGGESRSHSVRAALRAALAEWGESPVALVHDAARPLASPALFDEGIGLLRESGADAVIPAAAVADTIKQAGRDHVVTATLDRSTLWAVQTPQFFRTTALAAALESADAELAAATDDASLVEAAGGSVLVMPWGELNPKITTQADLELVDRVLAGTR